MDYNEAYNILDKNADVNKIFSFILENNNQSAIEYIKEITKCDDTIAKAIILDLEDGLITEKDNKLKETKTENNIPKCPTCQSTNLKKITVTSKAINTTMFGIFGTKRHKTFHCNNCGYEW